MRVPHSAAHTSHTNTPRLREAWRCPTGPATSYKAWETAPVRRDVGRGEKAEWEHSRSRGRCAFIPQPGPQESLLWAKEAGQSQGDEQGRIEKWK